MKKIIIVAFFSIAFFTKIQAQEDLDVLAESGAYNMFHSYLLSELDTLVKQRKLSVENSLVSQEDLLIRQAKLKADYLTLIGGLPEKTPLNDSVVATIAGDGYAIDKVWFESRPNHHVTANFYYPTTGTAPFPGILMTCGHLPEGKAGERYQNMCMLLAQSGFAVLIVDPICQAERYQVNSLTTGELEFKGGSGTTAATILDVGAMLGGTAVMAYELWDNHRGVDYLISRTEVDSDKIGCTGSSGGGQQATFLCAFDDRIKVGAVNSFIMNEPTLYKTIGPQTGSQNLSYEGFYEIDHPEYITMFAPKPFLILAATQDFFEISATKETYEESKDIYNTFGSPEKIGFFEHDSEHGYFSPRRAVATMWFKKWFYDNTDTVIEPAYTARTIEQLNSSPTGQVVTSFTEEKTITDLNVELVNSYIDKRTDFWANNTLDSCLSKVKELIRLKENYNTPEVATTGNIIRDEYTIDKIKITDNTLTPLTGLMFKQKGISGKQPGVLYIDGRGKDTDAKANGLIEHVYVDSGKIVFAVDLRGFGETTDNPGANESKHRNKEHRNAVISLYTGKTLIGQRVEDIQKALDVLLTQPEVDENDITIVGIDRAGTSVVHAVAFNNDAYKRVELRYSDTTWMPHVENPLIFNALTHVVPSALMYYDLTDLIKVIAPEKISYEIPEFIPDSVISGVSDKLVNNQQISIKNYPNPFNSNTVIEYRLPSASNVSLSVYNETGKQIKVLVDQYQEASTYKINFKANGLPVGIYFYNLKIDGRLAASNKMMFLK